MNQKYNYLYIPVLFVILGIYLTFFPTISSGFRRMQTDLGDTRFNNYILEHSYRSITNEEPHQEFWNAPFFYPATNVTAYSDLLLGVAPPYWLLRSVGFLPDTAFQIWVMLICALNFLAMYLLLRKCFDTSTLAASVGSYVFTFGNSRIAQLGHQQLLPQFYLVLCMAAIAKILSSSESLHTKRIWCYVFTLSLVLQFYSGVYLPWFFCFVLAIAGFWILFLAELRGKAIEVLLSLKGTLPICTLIGLALLFPLTSHYLLAAEATGFRSFSEVRGYLPDFSAWLYYGNENFMYGWLSKSSFYSELTHKGELQLGAGFATTMLALFGLFISRKAEFAKIMLLTSIVTVVLSTTLPGGIMLWEWVYKLIPGAQALRVAGRIGIFLLIPVSIGLAVFFDFFLRNTNGRKTLFITLLLTTVVVGEQIRQNFSYNKLLARQTSRMVARHIENFPKKCSAFALLQHENASYADWKYHVDAMWVQLHAGIPTLNGHSGNIPPGWPLEDIHALDRVGDKTESIVVKIQNWISDYNLDPSGICVVKRYGRGNKSIRIEPLVPG